MRTKALILSAMVGIAGITTSLAAPNVYSINVVGYINLDLDTGFTMVANQLDNMNGNLVKDLIPSPAGSPSVYKFNGVGYDTMSYLDFLGGWFPTEVADVMTLAPGEGLFIQLDQAQTITFVGDVMEGSPLSVPVVQGYQIVSSKVPQAGTLETDLSYVPSDGDNVYLFDPTTQGYKTSSFLGFLGGWYGDFGNPGEPPVAVGESFFLQSVDDKSWDRNFEIE